MTLYTYTSDLTSKWNGKSIEKILAMQFYAHMKTLIEFFSYLPVTFKLS